jgi:hypothetical protein
MNQRIGTDCHCLFCRLSEDQKQVASDSARKLEEKFRRVNFSPHNVSIGSYAEAVFGALFDLPVNLRDGGDGGKDFTLCSNGKFDVKGTSFFQPQPLELEPYRKTSYVFIRVNLPHAYFQGFAYGKDRWERIYDNDRKLVIGYQPRALRSFEELAAKVEDSKRQGSREKEEWPF